MSVKIFFPNDFYDPASPYHFNIIADKYINAMALAFIINGRVVDTVACKLKMGSILLGVYTGETKITDVTDNSIDSEKGYLLKFETLDEDITIPTEKRFGAILLSNPIIINIHNIHEYSQSISPGWMYSEDKGFYPPPDWPYPVIPAGKDANV